MKLPGTTATAAHHHHAAWWTKVWVTATAMAPSTTDTAINATDCLVLSPRITTRSVVNDATSEL